MVFHGQSWLFDRTLSDGEGRFSFRLPFSPWNPRWKSFSEQFSWYVVAGDVDRGTIGLMASLGSGSHVPHEFIVNELTTVAAVWTSAQFLAGSRISGNAIGVRNALGNARNLVDLRSGQPGPRVFDGVNIQTTTLARLHSLGALLGACAGEGDCAGLFAAATGDNGDRPTNTLQAAQQIARNPWRNVQALFDLLPAQDEAVYPPILRYPPTDWTLSLISTGGGLDSPGGISIAANGEIWANNNFMVGSQSFLNPGIGSVPGLGVTRLTPDGKPISPPFGYEGGGTYGAGFGLAIDQHGRVWVGNFAGSSVSEFSSDGRPLSPAPSGYTAGGGTASVQGTVVDQFGNIWSANQGGDSISFFPVNRPELGVTWTNTNSPKCRFNSPFGVAIDRQGYAWVANLTNPAGTSGSIVRVDRNHPERCPDGPIRIGGAPQGIALDSLGNLWVTHFGRDYVTLYQPSLGTWTDITPPDSALSGGWGIAVDGADNVWVADFWGNRVVELCGVAGNCPPGHETGDLISTKAGYGGAGGMQHITSVVIDQSGNVLVANNNNDQALCDTGIALDAEMTVELEKRSMECGGNGILVFYGIAAPVAAPLIGPPRRP